MKKAAAPLLLVAVILLPGVKAEAQRSKIAHIGFLLGRAAIESRKCLDIFLPGSEKVQEIEPLIFAGLGYA